MLLDRPHRKEPLMKMIAEIWKINFRPYRSPNFPTSTVDTVSASR